MDVDRVSALVGRAVADLPDSFILVEGHASDGISRKIIFVNHAFTEMTGFSAEEAIGQDPGITIGPETSREALATIQKAREAMLPARVELLKYRKDRTTFWVEMDLVPIFDPDGTLASYLSIMRDVTDRHAAQLQRMETERLVAIGTLAAGVAHEMNNPLAYALMNLGFVEEELAALVALAQEPALPRWCELQGTLSEVKHGIGRVAQIVRDIATFSQLDTMPAGRCKVPVLIERAVRMARFRIPVCATITVEHDEGIAEVNADPARLAQVFLNLVINALDAIPPDEPQRCVHVRAFNAKGEVIVEIRDEGRGIPADVLPRIFDPFFTTKDTGKGTGLGLSISYGVVRGMGGTMKVESQVGVGTTVRIALPPAASISMRTVQAVTETSPPRSGMRLRILVVDDEPMIGRALQRSLGPVDDVTVVHGGQDAIALLESGADFDLLLCDLSMPGMTGAGLYEQIEKRWPEIAPRVYIMTGGASNDATRRFLEESRVPRLDKPLDLPRLRLILNQLRSSSEQLASQTR